MTKEQKRMEFDEEFVILLRREQRGESVSGLVPVVRRGGRIERDD